MPVGRPELRAQAAIFEPLILVGQQADQKVGWGRRPSVGVSRSPTGRPGNRIVAEHAGLEEVRRTEVGVSVGENVVASTQAGVGRRRAGCSDMCTVGGQSRVDAVGVGPT